MVYALCTFHKESARKDASLVILNPEVQERGRLKISELPMSKCGRAWMDGARVEEQMSVDKEVQRMKDKIYEVKIK